MHYVVAFVAPISDSRFLSCVLMYFKYVCTYREKVQCQVSGEPILSLSLCADGKGMVINYGVDGYKM